VKHKTPIYFGSVLLERNRWAAQRQPSFAGSSWLPRSAQAGFDGVELWENHAAFAGEAELRALEAGPLPVAIFNSYSRLSPDAAQERQRTVELVKRLRAKGIKFNFGRAPEALEDELRVVMAWAKAMPGVRMLCECHSGTVLEAPAVAAAVAARWPAMQAIVHPFGKAQALRAWFAAMPERIAHAHVAATDDHGKRCRLWRCRKAVLEGLSVLRDHGFAGAFSIEFTEGVGDPPEDPEALFAAACDDLIFLREHWT